VLAFTGASIAATLAITALAFGGLSLAGYVTPKDLTAFGGFLTTGLFGVVAAFVLNLVLRSPAVVWSASMVGVFVFAGLIAYDTQRLRRAYDQVEGDLTATRLAATYGALSLFINFINLFQLLLMSMTGDRR
jgi:FtsH-binding integral membrane protein